MHKLLGMAAAGVIALTAMAASAGEVTGKISNINLTANTFMVDGKTYTANPDNTVGVKLSDLADGDTVTVSFSERNANSGKSPINAMTLKKD